MSTYRKKPPKVRKLNGNAPGLGEFDEFKAEAFARKISDKKLEILVDILKTCKGLQLNEETAKDMKILIYQDRPNVEDIMYKEEFLGRLETNINPREGKIKFTFKPKDNGDRQDNN